MGKRSREIENREIVVIGAGLVGALIAILLQEAGYKVTVFERFGDIRGIPKLGRSINLVATVRGLRALGALPAQIKEDLLKLGSHVTGRVIHTDSGEQMFQRYGKDDTEYNHSISRYDLNRFLIQRAEDAGATLHFGHQIVDFKLGETSGGFPTLRFRVDGGGASGGAESTSATEKVFTCRGPVIAADGGGSAVRAALQALGVCSASREVLDSGYKEMLFPKAAATAAGLAPHGLHIWPRGQHFLMALVNLDGSFTGTLYMKSEGEESFAAVESGGEAAAKAFLEEHYSDALPALGGASAAATQLVSNPRGLLGTVRTAAWAHTDQVCLVGDAAHAIVPFFGQGMNCGFEDCRELLAQLAAHTHDGDGSSKVDFAAAFAAYEAARKPNANAIADMALENYTEMMRDTADPTFRLRKATESALENSSLGVRFRSRYAMVCYGGAGNVTYRAAQRLGEVQWDIVCELSKGVRSVETAKADLDLELAAKLLDEKLLPLQKELAVDLTQVSHHE